MSPYVLLVRHGETSGNREGRYVGSTDEELTAMAVRSLERARREKLPQVLSRCFEGEKDVHEVAIRLYVSPMRRCRETAAILFPGIKGTVIDDFREMNFGQFEYRNYGELNGNPAYQAYIDSGGEAAFPGGESKAEFCKRVVRAAEPVIFRKELTVIVAHGGTIMAIMDRFSRPHQDYFSWRLAPGGMLLVKRNERSLEVVER